MAIAAPSPKDLAANSKATRDAAIKSLRAALNEGAEIDAEETGDWDSVSIDARYEEKEMLVLWKGLFYCMWMSDKPLVQQELCTSLANLLLEVRPSQKGRAARVKASMAFLKGFWATMTREWGGIDRYRADKYYLLMRRYIVASFQLLMREEWDAHAINDFAEVLTGAGGPLNVRDPKTPFGVLSHVTEIYLDCLCAALEQRESTPMQPVPLLSIMAPIAHALCFAPTKQMFATIQSNAITPLLSLCDASLEDLGAPATKKRKMAVEASPVEPLRMLLEVPMSLPDGVEGSSAMRLKQSVLQYLFDQAAQRETPDANRHRIYTLFREHEVVQ